jgi:hypothetical protein
MDALTNCERHEPFETKAAAQAALTSMKYRMRRKGEKVQGVPTVFKCKAGKAHWHIGRRNGRRGR